MYLVFMKTLLCPNSYGGTRSAPTVSCGEELYFILKHRLPTVLKRPIKAYWTRGFPVTCAQNSDASWKRYFWGLISFHFFCHINVLFHWSHLIIDWDNIKIIFEPTNSNTCLEDSPSLFFDIFQQPQNGAFFWVIIERFKVNNSTKQQQ